MHLRRQTSNLCGKCYKNYATDYEIILKSISMASDEEFYRLWAPLMDNLTLINNTEDEGENDMDEPKSIRYVAMGILVVLSISGTIGNALVLYVFSRQKQKLSSTIFILTLACMDFITSLITMPYTITIELLEYDVTFDAVCKIYHLLVTTTIPFSAFVMVAIAVDRYLCIVHPFKHTMTIKRAKILVVLLAILALTLGIICSLMYGVRHKAKIPNAYLNLTATLSNSERNISAFLSASQHNGSYSSGVGYGGDGETTVIIFTQKCSKNNLIFDESFFNVYQKIYSSFFGVCAVIVIVLYAIIYRSVLTRRRRRLHLTNKCCGFLTQGGLDQEHEQTEFTVINNSQRDKSPSSLNGSKKYISKDSLKMTELNGNTSAGAERAVPTVDKDALVRPGGVSKAKMEKLRMANIKTALMLSIVALTYIIAFMPAWLMALRTISMNAIVFYLYFTYNVANPIIYAFLNQSFRNHLQTLFKCGK